jgi:hypothetical protein
MTNAKQLYEQFANDPKYDKEYVREQLVEAIEANNTRTLTDMACHFYLALRHDRGGV